MNPLIKNSWPIEIKGALRTLAGGTASRLGGGKFANGATSAAMAFLFKEGLHAQEDAFGSVTAKPVGKGITVADLDSVESDLKTIAGTKRGAVLFSNIKSRGGIDLEACRGCGKLVYDPRADKIIIDLNISPSIMTAGGKITATTLRILAHELGHAGTWTTNVATRMRDTDHPSLPTGNRMLNTIHNENAIMNELGQASRTQY